MFEKLNGTGQLGKESTSLNRKIMDTFNVLNIKKIIIREKEEKEMSVKKWNFDSKMDKGKHTSSNRKTRENLSRKRFMYEREGERGKAPISNEIIHWVFKH